MRRSRIPVRTSVRHSLRALTGAGAFAALVGAAGCVMARPSPAVLGVAPSDLGAAEVRIPSTSGSVLRGWLAAGRPDGGAVLLLHGVGANRLVMVDRARFLRAAGYTVLLIDFQGHGESPGERVTFGAVESRDAHAALDFLRAQVPGQRVGVIGVSMGGAAALLGDAPLAADALVLESVYPTIDLAIADRMRAWLWVLGAPVARVLMAELEPVLGVPETALRPIDRIGRVREPVFVISGTADRYTHIAEARALYDSVRAPKEFWAVDGAAHVDMHAYAKGEYEVRVGEFLGRYLRRESGDAAGGKARPSAVSAGFSAVP